MSHKFMLLVVCSCLAGQLLAQTTKPAKASDSTATFNIRMGHGNAGTETFTVAKNGKGYLLTSTVHLREYGEPLFSQQTQQLTADWSPLHYTLFTEMAKEHRTTEASIAKGKVQMHSASGSDVKDKIIDLRSPSLVLDSVIPSQFQVLINEYNAAHAKQSLEFQMLMPQVMAEFSGTVIPAGTDKGTLNRQPVTLNHYRLLSRGNDLHIWTDSTGQLMRVSLRTRNTEFVRAGFQMDGLADSDRPKSVVMLH